jgi:hypothetical protein
MRMEPDRLPPLASPDRSTLRHSWSDETTQFRVKLRRFSSCPPEFTVQRISFENDLERYRSAAERGQSSVHRPRGKRAPSAERDPESVERSQRRAKSTLRLLVNELAPNHFCTFTTRETGPEYFTSADWSTMWGHFVRLVRMAGIDMEYVAVLERHPANPNHFHLHVALRGHIHYNWLRRFWHQAIVWHRDGVRLTRMLRGSDAPGNIQDQPVKAPRGSFKQVRKIARYISKYVTKDLISEFNKKRYWPSKGIDLAAAQVFWLDSLSMSDAVREACQMLGQWDDLANVPAQRLFMPSDRVAWCAIDPDSTPPPPF